MIVFYTQGFQTLRITPQTALLYHDRYNEDIGKLSGPTLVGRDIDTTIVEVYDRLNVNEFKEVVSFIMSHFKATRNRKNTSG